MSGGGIVLVHGFSGAPADLEPLATALDPCSTVTRVALHGETPAAFDADILVGRILGALDAESGRRLVVVGHSTGGLLALEALSRIPDARIALLVLASTPPRVGPGYASRWERHSDGAGPGLLDLGRIAALARERTRGLSMFCFPVLVVHGAEDALVPVDDAGIWVDGLPGPARAAIVPGAGHDLFRSPVAVDVVRRAIEEALVPPTDDDEQVVARLCRLEPGLERFLARSPHSARQIARSAGAAAAADLSPDLDANCPAEPTRLNIEVTTRCTLACPHCARTLHEGRKQQDMPRAVFRQVLGLLPHAWRVTLVGLGEPTLHPEIDFLVGDASAMGRRVTLVTNAAALDRGKARALLGAGLDTITFSLDAVDPALAATVRPGAPLERVLENVRGFLEEAREADAPIEASVFCAVGAATVLHLPELVRTVAELGVAALVLTDLNFEENRESTLRNRAGPEEQRAVREALAAGFAAGLPIFGVRAFEELGLARRFREFLLTTPAELWSRSTQHRNCLSPWQAIPVGVDGTVTACDCRPDEIAGNLLTQPLDEIWNGEVLCGLRAKMRGDPAPRKCLLCPRF